MRKFKHKELNIVAIENSNCYDIQTLNGNKLGAAIKVYVETSPDWKEVMEPTFKVVSFKNPNNGNVYEDLGYGLYGRKLAFIKISNTKDHFKKTKVEIPYQYCLEHYPIHSVICLIDSKVFTIKDNITWLDKYGEIKTILFQNNVCFAVVNTVFTVNLDKATVVEKEVKEKTKYIILPDGTKIPVGKGDKLLIEF